MKRSGHMAIIALAAPAPGVGEPGPRGFAAGLAARVTAARAR
jgi:hypothetical protein